MATSNLCDDADAAEWTNIDFDDDVGALAAALRLLVTFRDLQDYHPAQLDQLGDSTTWSHLEELVALLERLHARSGRVAFRVAWGL